MHSNPVSKSGKTLIAVDLDDVLFDCNRTLEVIISKEFGFNGTYTDFIKQNPELISNVFEFLYGKYHHDSQPVIGALEAILNIATRYKLSVITGRSEMTRAQTTAWLEKKLSRHIRRSSLHKQFPFYRATAKRKASCLRQSRYPNHH